MRAFPKAAALAAAVLVLSVAVAFGADTTVTLPWGDWLNAILAEAMTFIGVLLMAIITFAASKLPPAAQAFITAERIKQVEQVLERAIGFGINSLGEKVKGQTISVDVKNEVVEQALQYVIDHAPQKLIDWMGGIDAIREKIIARLPVS